MAKTLPTTIIGRTSAACLALGLWIGSGSSAQGDVGEQKPFNILLMIDNGIATATHSPLESGSTEDIFDREADTSGYHYSRHAHRMRRQTVLTVIGAALVLVVIVMAFLAEPRGLQTGQAERVDTVVENDGGTLHKLQRPLMGTTFTVTLWTPTGELADGRKALTKVFDELAGLERRISSWRPDSETSRINRGAGKEPLEMSATMEVLLNRSLYWAKMTGGAFDVTGGALFELWEEARTSGVLPSQDDVDRRRSLTGSENVYLGAGQVRLLKPGMKLGFGAIGKGFAADRAADCLVSSGVSNFLIDAGGDLLARGRRGGRPWHVAIRHPRERSFLAGFEAEDCAVASSGDYERFFTVDGNRFAHIIDPRSGHPAEHLTSVTVIARCAADADALATALFVMKPRPGLELVESLPRVEAILVDDAGELALSSGLHLQGKRLTLNWP